MHSKIKKDGYTIVPLEVFIQKGFAKVEIGLAKGKKLHDKRDALAKKTNSEKWIEQQNIKFSGAGKFFRRHLNYYLIHLTAF